jgi:hypothetical protein
MLAFLTRKTVFALSVILHLSNIYVASGASCGCSSIVIPVHVDVLIPKDPADPFGGLKSNASSLRRLDVTYDVFGVFCQPAIVSPKSTGQLKTVLVLGDSNSAFQMSYSFLRTDSRTPTNIGRFRQRSSETILTQGSPVTVGCPPWPSIGSASG